MPGVHDGLVRQREQPGTDRLLDRRAVRVRPPRGAGAALEEGVAGEHDAEVRDVQADRARRVTRRVEHLESRAADRDALTVREVDVPQLVGVRELPQRLVGRMQEDRCTDTLAQCGRHPYVVVVRVGAHDRLDRTVADDGEDGVDVVRGIDHDALRVVTDHPDVVVDVERLTVERERPGDDTVVDTRPARRAHHSTTTERRTSPWCIRSNAASTSPIPISSVTNASRSRRPWR